MSAGAMFQAHATDLAERQQKRFADLAARACMRGYVVWRSDPADGTQRFFVGRNGLVQVLPDLEALERALDALKT